MSYFNVLKTLHRPAETKIVLLLMDGLGGLPGAPGGETELEAAPTPHLDRLAAEGALGLGTPIRPGITPGSGPAHLSIFGYDPLEFTFGRGVLEALGIGMQVQAGDIAARGNFCTLDAEGKILDRRAGRIRTELAAPIVERLSAIRIPGVEVEVRVVREYRIGIVMRGEGLHPDLQDTDPQRTGAAPLPVIANRAPAEHTAALFNQWLTQAHEMLATETSANGLTLRGFSTLPDFPSYAEVFGLRAACFAVYPMYKGVSRVVGMQVVDFPGESPAEQFAAVAQHWQDYDFFFIHIKKTDSMGEDGNFEGKRNVIAAVDTALPELLKLKPDVLIVTGDHSTPSGMKAHSWHPVPILLWAAENGLPDTQQRFGERACALGGLGHLPSYEVLPLALAHANRLEKFGA